MVKSYLVKNRDKDKVFKWAKQQNFMGRWMPESHEFYHVYLGEYPWAPAFLYHYIPYYHHDGWTNGAMDKKIPAKILVTDDQYLSSGSSIDCSTNEAVSVKLPVKFIVDGMGLVQKHIDGRFFDKKGDLEQRKGEEDQDEGQAPGGRHGRASQMLLISGPGRRIAAQSGWLWRDCAVTCSKRPSYAHDGGSDQSPIACLGLGPRLRRDHI